MDHEEEATLCPECRDKVETRLARLLTMEKFAYSSMTSLRPGDVGFPHLQDEIETCLELLGWTDEEDDDDDLMAQPIYN